MGGWVAACTAVLSVHPPIRPSAQDAAATLQRASAAYQTLSSLSADFSQIVQNPLLGTPDTTRGRLHLVRPSRFAMRFTDPAGDRVVADGRHLWLYTPSTTPGQVIRTRIPSDGVMGPNLIGQFVERPAERYTARARGADSLPSGMADVVELDPRAPDLPFSNAVIWVDRDDGLVRRIEITETSRQRRVIVLRNLRVNRGVPSREITFSPPAGVRVVDQ